MLIERRIGTTVRSMMRSTPIRASSAASPRATGLIDEDMLMTSKA